MKELTKRTELQLKKVTEDMKTKNMNKEDLPAVAVPAARSPAAVAVKSPSAPHLPPVCEIQRSNWVVENYVNHQGVLKLDQCDIKQIVYISKCTNATVHVDCKVKSITLDGCKRVNLIVHVCPHPLSTAIHLLVCHIISGTGELRALQSSFGQ